MPRSVAFGEVAAADGRVGPDRREIEGGYLHAGFGNLFVLAGEQERYGHKSQCQ